MENETEKSQGPAMTGREMMEAIIRSMDDLQNEVQDFIDTEFWPAHNALNNKLKKYERCYVGVRTRRRKRKPEDKFDPVSMSIEWIFSRFFNRTHTGERVGRSDNVKKIRGTDSYSIAHLRRHTKEFEWALVEEIEAKLVPYRRRARMLSKLAAACRDVIKAEEAMEEADQSEDFADAA